MKIIFDNIIYSLQSCGGISVVWTNLLGHILGKECDVTMLEYDGAADNISRRTLAITQDHMVRRRMRLLKVMRFFNPRISREMTEDRPFIFHSSYYRTCSNPLAINVTTVHDFAYELFVGNSLLRWLHCRQQYRAIRKADHVVCISENTRKDLHRFLPDVDMKKVSVIYNGVDARFTHLPESKMEDYVLYVGKRDRYKNFNAIVKPLAELGYKLKIAGVALDEDEVEYMNESGLQYEYCGKVDDEELNRLYNGAICLLYPSLYEGFGLPVLEAQMAGCPVIACNTSSIPEVIGDANLLLDDITTETLKEKLLMVTDPDKRKDIIARGLENTRRFSWKKMAEDYWKLYNELYSKSTT